MAPVVACINHLLAQEPWARRQLALHAGKIACIDAGSASLRLRVAAGGSLEFAAPGERANVTIRVKLSDLPLMLQNRERAFSYVGIEGDAEFASTMSQLAGTLRWEAEHDLEKVVGPIAAMRIVSGARTALAAALVGHRKLAENVAEFLLEEQPMLVRPSAVDEFSSDVSHLRDGMERIAKRIEKLERIAAPAPASSAQQSLDLK